MLSIIVPAVEGFNEETNEFIIIKPEQTLELEHSLVALSKWESKWEKPFFSKKEKTYEETMDYIKCMTLDANVEPDIYSRLTKSSIDQINQYIKAPMTATTFSNPKSKTGKGSSEQVTAELIYYWMISFNIPVEFENWHVNRLLTLIQVCEVKNQPPKKMSKRDVMSRNAQLNAMRRQQMNTRG